MKRSAIIAAACVTAGTVLAGLVSGPARATPKQASLCDRSETTYFHCSTSGDKSLDVCGGETGAVQYRFGRAPTAELSYPASHDEKPMRFAHYSRYRTDRVELAFERHGASYAVFDYSEGNRRQSGVRVTTAAGREVTIACKGKVQSRLLELEDRLPCDSDSALTLGNCPE